MSRRRRRRAFTLAEALVTLVVAGLLLGVVYGALRLFYARDRSSAATLVDRSLARQDIRLALEALIMRLREGTKVVAPAPGITSTELVFRDVLNQKVRLRLNSESGCLVSERWEQGSYRFEATPSRVRTGSGKDVDLSGGIRIANCRNATFTPLSPSCVVLSLTLAYGASEDALMTAVHLRNHDLALRGERK